ncbi:DUF4065 domain-containing protein [Aerococcaceae bacterium zg-ZJ1578]|uniref:Panacea domain-containing protein n=1 Tax=Aerococcaceae bacterium zg-252 TaxID=2796928 RepID=UPI001A2F6EF7|nr:DUF4065 domain-containing protein [Aerococcaceae bacterium zg-1578]
MDRLTTVACYLISSYENITSTKFDNSELMLQKLMYFSQKTAYALTGTPLFENQFEGWVHGPVLTELRYFFDSLPCYNENDLDLTETDKYIIDNTIHNYGKYAAWTLRELSHDEESWKKSREGLSSNDIGTNVIMNEDIKKDAENYRILDHQYDMYLDEFEDIDIEEFEHV